VKNGGTNHGFELTILSLVNIKYTINIKNTVATTETIDPKLEI